MTIFYNPNNLENNYLSPYVQVHIDFDTTILRNTLYHTEVILKVNRLQIQKILDLLMNGVNTENLLLSLSEITKQEVELYEYLIQKFIIE